MAFDGASSAGSCQVPSVVIRRAQEGDVEVIKRIFAEGMRSLRYPLVVEACRMYQWKIAVAGTVGSLVAAVALPQTLLITSALTVVAIALMVAYIAYRTCVGLEGYIKMSLGGDLADLTTYYSDSGSGPGSRFFVAEVPPYCFESSSGESVCKMREVVGIVGLDRKSDKVGELRRMSVLKSFQGRKISKGLCQALIQHAHESGFSTVKLSTSSSQKPAIKLYMKMGWEEVKVVYHGYIKEIFMELDVEKAVEKSVAQDVTEGVAKDAVKDVAEDVVKKIALVSSETDSSVATSDNSVKPSNFK